MPSEMFGDVILTRDVPERGLRAGDVGTVVEWHVVPDGREEGYSVEFDMTGTTVAIETLPASALRLPTLSLRFLRKSHGSNGINGGRSHEPLLRALPGLRVHA